MLEAIFAGLFGLLIGSFLNVCIYRLPRDLSVVHPRSFCPGCERPIAWFDNIPVLTWMILRGRCRHCSAPIPARYPIVEALTGALFFIGVLSLGPTLAALKFCAYAAIMVALIFTDLEERILPDEFTLGGTLVGLGLSWFVHLPPTLIAFFLPPESEAPLISLSESAFAAVVLSGTLWGIGALYKLVRGREGLGFGDVKMVACMGAFAGLAPALMTIVVGSVIGSVAGVIFIWIGRKDASSYELPFGSFLGIAALLTAIFSGPFESLSR